MNKIFILISLLIFCSFSLLLFADGPVDPERRGITIKGPLGEFTIYKTKEGKPLSFKPVESLLITPLPKLMLKPDGC